MKFLPYGRQNISEADIEAVVAILRSDFLTQGPTIPRFEKVVADRGIQPHSLNLVKWRPNHSFSGCKHYSTL